jgi:tetratricopeptide (TPR) repeat protein
VQNTHIPPENVALQQEIDALIAALGEDFALARPAIEREVIEKIRLMLDRTRDQRTISARPIWELYLPYAAKRCYQLVRLEEGWEDELDYFASENAQFWLDNAGAFLEQGEITEARNALGQVMEASRMMKHDRIVQMDILLQALDHAIEVNDKKLSIQLYEEAEKVYGKHLSGGTEYTGSAWLPKIKKMGQQLRHHHDRIRRYYHYAETVTVSIVADSQGDLERLIDYLQQSLVGKVKVTKRAKAVDEQVKPAGERFRARIKITLE